MRFAFFLFFSLMMMMMMIRKKTKYYSHYGFGLALFEKLKNVFFGVVFYLLYPRLLKK